jgi:hypothetical protein
MDNFAVKLSDVLRHPDDLEKLPALKAEYQRKKTAINSQLRAGLREQVQVTKSGLSSIQNGQNTVQQIKEEMARIDQLCMEAQAMIRDFPNINRVSQIHRNFAAVESMMRNLEDFKEKLSRVGVMLHEDEADEQNMPNLLNIHYELTQLRNIRDDAMEQITRSEDTSFQGDLERLFKDLDDTIDAFDERIGTIALNLIDILVTGNNSLVVRFAVIIEAEEKSDRQVLALQEALKDHKEMAARFQGMANGAKQVHGYKDKFVQAIRLRAEGHMQETKRKFLEDSSKLEKSLRWYFNDLNAVKQGMVPLMPKKWKILRTYVNIYHTLLHDLLVSLIDDADTSTMHMLAILNWPDKYYSKMEKLGFKSDDLLPHLIDSRESELVKDFRQLIIKKLDDWLNEIQKTERKDFQERNVEGSQLDTDEFGYFRTRSLVDIWRMLKEQVEAAGSSQRVDVIEGVVDSMFVRLRNRQIASQEMLDREAERYISGGPDIEGFQALQDWLVGTANDQIACIDDNEEEDRYGYLSSFRNTFRPLVSALYMEHADAELSALRDGYVDLSTHCIAKFAQLIFAVDFRAVMPDFFTPKWYITTTMKQIVVTFEEYANDYRAVLHHSLLDIFIEELSDELLICYLSSVRNKGAKFRRSDPFQDKLFNDVSTVFEFFTTYPAPEVADIIKQKWRVTERFSQLLLADKSELPEVFASFKADYWDLQLSWVEAVLRSRDDFDRNLLDAVKARGAQLEVTRGPETIMSKVK